jgi:hypothetical protein
VRVTKGCVLGLIGVWGGVACASSPSPSGGRASDGGVRDNASASQGSGATPDSDRNGPDGASSEGPVRLRDASARREAAASAEPTAAIVSDASASSEGETTLLSTTSEDWASFTTSASASSAGAAHGDASSQGVPEFTQDWSGVQHALCHALLYCRQLDGEPLLLRLHFERADAPFDACLQYFEDEFFGTMEFERGQLTFDWERVANIAQCRERVVHVGELIVPLTEPGSECRWDEQCRGGICDTAVSCPSTCRAGSGAGEECVRSDDCADRDCTDGRCVGAQEPIFDLPLGAECSWAWDKARYCAAGSWCSREQYCVEEREAGESCNEVNAFCPRDYVCADDETGGMSCAKVTLLPIGAMCSSPLIAIDGTLGVCDSVSLEVCRDGMCQRPPAGDEGDPCISVDLKSTCNPGLYCDWGANICRAIKMNGETCRDANECQCVNGVCSEVACSEH